MEGFLRSVFGAGAGEAAELKRDFSFLIVPMLNPDGVVCGLCRPTLEGDDQNRVWWHPGAGRHPEVVAMQRAMAGLAEDREILFFIDFHGHTTATGCFTYSSRSGHLPQLHRPEAVFPRVMCRLCPYFRADLSCPQGNARPLRRVHNNIEKCDGTARVAVRRRFRVLLSYTLEMSLGGSREGLAQFTPDIYRSMGAAVARSLQQMFLAPGGAQAEDPDPAPRNKKRRTYQPQAE
jgi:hypothetical protein